MRDLEMEYDRGISTDRLKEKEYAEFLEKKFKDGDNELRVYVDEEEDKYYLDVFAAFSLEMIDYNEATSRYDEGRTFFEISKSTLEVLKSVFKDRIEYISLQNKKTEKPNKFNNIPKVDNNDNFKSTDKKNEAYDNKVEYGEIDINNEKEGPKL